MIDPQQLEAEQRNMRLLRTIVDLTAAILSQGNLTIPEAIELIQATKKTGASVVP